MAKKSNVDPLKQAIDRAEELYIAAKNNDELNVALAALGIE